MSSLQRHREVSSYAGEIVPDFQPNRVKKLDYSDTLLASHPLQREEELLLPEPPRPAPPADPVRGHHPVARDEQTDRVPGHDVPHRPGRTRLPRRLGHVPVAQGLPP